MHAAYRSGGLMIALSAFIALAAVKHHAPVQTVGVHTPYAVLDDDFTDDTTGSIGTVFGSSLRLTDAQRGFIFLGVINLPDIPEIEMNPPQLGEQLPSSTPLHTIPRMVTRKIPELAGYRFAKLQDRILLVGATDRKVNVAIPRYKLMVR